MLTIEQIKALLDEGLMVYSGTKGLNEKGRPHVDYRVVWWEPETYTDGPTDCSVPGRLMKAHPSDESGEEWKPVETPDFNPEEYLVHTDSEAYGGHFRYFSVLPEWPVKGTRVVKFDNPVQAPEGYRTLPYYVRVTAPDEITEEWACERAIDVMLSMPDTPFNGDNCHPILVI